MSPFLRKVRTASGPTAVQIVQKRERRNEVLEHLGSAHDEATLAALMQAGREKIHARQGVLDLEPSPGGAGAIVQSTRSRLLLEVVGDAWTGLGLDAFRDEAFFQLVAARLIEPTSMLDTARLLSQIGITPVHLSTMKRCPGRIQERKYRDQIADKCFDHARAHGDVSLGLYDVTTLYLEAEHEDDLRKVGFSKEAIWQGLAVRRVGRG